MVDHTAGEMSSEQADAFIRLVTSKGKDAADVPQRLNRADRRRELAKLRKVGILPENRWF